MVEVSVTDTGPGIPDKMKMTIFYRLSQDSTMCSSYGLGLQIVRMLTKAYGGRVWADDRVQGHPEYGATIRFRLRKAEQGE